MSLAAQQATIAAHSATAGVGKQPKSLYWLIIITESM